MGLEVLPTGFAKEVLTRYESEGVGTFGTSLFVGMKSHVPVTMPVGGIITVIETGGQSPLETHDEIDQPAHQRPALQVVARGRTYVEAMTKARQAYSKSRVRNTTLGGTFYVELNPMQEPFELPLDGNGIPRVAFNVRAVKVPSA